METNRNEASLRPGPKSIVTVPNSPEGSGRVFYQGQLQQFPWVEWRGHVSTSLTNGVPRPEQSSKNDVIITNAKALWI